MKKIAEYLEHAHNFERLAASEEDPKKKKQLQEQANAYHKLAQRRARNLGAPMPDGPPHLR
jgi:hypothetical protein